MAISHQVWRRSTSTASNCSGRVQHNINLKLNNTSFCSLKNKKSSSFIIFYFGPWLVDFTNSMDISCQQYNLFCTELSQKSKPSIDLFLYVPIVVSYCAFWADTITDGGHELSLQSGKRVLREQVSCSVTWDKRKFSRKCSRGANWDDLNVWWECHPNTSPVRHYRDGKMEKIPPTDGGQRDEI